MKHAWNVGDRCHYDDTLDYPNNPTIFDGTISSISNGYVYLLRDTVSSLTGGMWCCVDDSPHLCPLTTITINGTLSVSGTVTAANPLAKPLPPVTVGSIVPYLFHGTRVHYDDSARFPKGPTIFDGTITSIGNGYMTITCDPGWVGCGGSWQCAVGDPYVSLIFGTTWVTTGVGQGVLDPAMPPEEKHAHIAGLDPETIDWDAHKAFKDSL